MIEGRCVVVSSARDERVRRAASSIAAIVNDLIGEAEHARIDARDRARGLGEEHGEKLGALHVVARGHRPRAIDHDSEEQIAKDRALTGDEGAWIAPHDHRDEASAIDPTARGTALLGNERDA